MDDGGTLNTRHNETHNNMQHDMYMYMYMHMLIVWLKCIHDIRSRDHTHLACFLFVLAILAVPYTTHDTPLAINLSPSQQPPRLRTTSKSSKHASKRTMHRELNS